MCWVGRIIEKASIKRLVVCTVFFLFYMFYTYILYVLYVDLHNFLGYFKIFVNGI